MGDFKKKLKALAALPDKVRKVLEEKEKVLNMSRVFRYASNFLYLGRGFNFPVALEGALKLKEISYIHAEGYPAAEMKHGPIAPNTEEFLMPLLTVIPLQLMSYYIADMRQCNVDQPRNLAKSVTVE